MSLKKDVRGGYRFGVASAVYPGDLVMVMAVSPAAGSCHSSAGGSSPVASPPLRTCRAAWASIGRIARPSMTRQLGGALPMH